jgi:hypothetical protein
MSAVYESAGPYKCSCGGWLLWVERDPEPTTAAPQRLVCLDCHVERTAPRWRLVEEYMLTAK